jgi:hypothetical protein
MTTVALTRRVRVPRWLPLTGLTALVLGSTVSGLPNHWVQDDLPIIAANPALHSLARPWSAFLTSYWPDPFPRELYRPLTSTILTAEWVVGGGNPLLFRVISILCYLAATVAVWRLAALLLRPGPAWLAAAWFAVHPVHVEAVAVAVNQAELLAGGLAAALTLFYIKLRRAGEPITGRALALLAGGYLAASLCKESGLMLPALLLAAEVTVIEDRRPWREKLAALRPLLLTLILLGLVVIEARNLVLKGNTTGTFTAEALFGLGIGGRALTMLGVVPEWLRLFFWPDHLRIDYSPQVIVAATHWGMPQTLGTIALAGAVAAAWFCRRRRPVVTFGILWVAIGLFPVSNVLVPTGIVLAERTLFLATIGVVIASMDVIGDFARRVLVPSSAGRIVMGTGTSLLLAMGLTRSYSRQTVWFDLPTLWFHAIIDAPNSYRAHHAYAQILFKAGAQRSAEYHYRRSLELFPRAWPIYLDYADKLREAGQCDPAVKLYYRLLLYNPSHSAARASLVGCLVYLGDYVAAAREARLGVSYGYQPKSFALYAQIADSAAQVKAPPGSIQLPPPVDTMPKQ